MNSDQEKRVKLKGILQSTASWIYFQQDGKLVVEFYDFSEMAHDTLGGDIAFLLMVSPFGQEKILSRLAPGASQTDSQSHLLELLEKRFQSYFEVKEWLEAEGIPFEKKHDTWV